MDLAHPARALAPTLDMVILEVLSRTTAALPLSQIHRQSGVGSVSGHLKALTRLVNSGVVLSVSGGYCLNRDHVAAPAVAALSQLRSELLRRIRDHAGSWYPKPAFVGVFGSLARREGDSISDIDILVVRRHGAGTDADQTGELATAIRGWSGNEAHVVDLTPEDLVRMAAADEPILASWQAEVVPLIGQLRIPAPARSPADHVPSSGQARGSR
jgi:predicted nucleotidyltransferase